MRGGQGWLHYDAVFRQQIQSFDSVDFSKINQSLYATTFITYSGGRAKYCPDCQMADHNREDCALNPARPMPVVPLSSRDRPGGGGGGAGKEKESQSDGMFCLQ